MTRATLLATTAALLLPVTAFAQSVDTDANVSTDTAGATANATAEGDATNPVEETVESATATANEAIDEVGETAEQIGDAATATAQDAAEATEQAVDDVAEGTTTEADASAETDLTAQAGVTTVGEITGAEVVDAAGESIGDVEMVVEQADGKAAVIGVGGFLGIGEHHVAIPASELKMDAEGRLMLSGYTEADLRQRSAFNATDAVALSSDVELPELG